MGFLKGVQDEFPMPRMKLVGGWFDRAKAVPVKKSSAPPRFWLILLLALSLAVAACDTVAATNPPSGGDSSSDAVIVAMLQNIKANGFDHNSGINGGMGGLWINWRYGTSPLQVNFQSSGQIDGSSVNSPRHDPLTDLRYLHNLWLYKTQHPGDKQFDGEIARYSAIVKHEYAPDSQGLVHDDHGWVYDELIAIADLSRDAAYQQAAFGMAAYYATTLYDARVGTIYKTESDHPNGHYRVDLALEAGCALIQAGTLDNHPDWVADGRKTVAFVYSHAYVPAYHVLLFQMDNVLNASGSVNADEAIDRVPYQHTKIEGGSVKMGEVAQEALSLLHVYLITKDQSFLDHATDLLGAFTDQNDPLGMWDTQHQGYFAAAVFPGSDAAHAGTPKVQTKAKESGRQFQMLEAFHLADALAHGRFQMTENALFDVALTKGYYAPGHGVLYETTANWQPLAIKHSSAHQDWVTTEAMGIMLEGLQSVNQSDPW
jgi:hypothetical protein